MKILLDEDVPHALRSELTDHEVYTVTWMGWSGTRNGVLIGLATAARFEVFVTCDRNVQHQQHIDKLGLAVIVLAARDSRVPTILKLVNEIRAALATRPQPGTISVIGTWRVEDTSSAN